MGFPWFSPKIPKVSIGVSIEYRLMMFNGETDENPLDFDNCFPTIFRQHQNGGMM